MSSDTKQHTRQLELNLWADLIEPVAAPKPRAATVRGKASSITQTSLPSPAESAPAAQLELLAAAPPEPESQQQAEQDNMPDPLDTITDDEASAPLPDEDIEQSVQDENGLPVDDEPPASPEELDQAKTIPDVSEPAAQEPPATEDTSDGNETMLDRPLDTDLQNDETEEITADDTVEDDANSATPEPVPEEKPFKLKLAGESETTDSPPPRADTPTVAAQPDAPLEDDHGGSITADVVFPGVPLKPPGKEDHRWVDTHELHIPALEDQIASRALAGEWAELLADGVSAGSLLTHARRSGKRTLPQVSSKTHIKADFIRRLELDDYNSLPKDAFYAKGWIKKLCALYQIPDEPFCTLISDWYAQREQREFPEALIPEEKTLTRRPIEEEQDSAEARRPGGVRLLAIAIAVIAILAAIGTVISVTRENPSPSDSPVVAATQPVALPQIISEQNVLDLLPPETLPLTELPVPGE